MVGGDRGEHAGSLLKCQSVCSSLFSHVGIDVTAHLFITHIELFG